MKWCFIICVCLFGIAVDGNVLLQHQTPEVVRNESGKVTSETLPSGPSNDIQINITVHFDRQLIEKLAREFNKSNTERSYFKKIVAVLMEDVQRIYEDQNLGVKVNFSYITKFLKKNAAFSGSDVDAPIYLQAYCNWQASKKKEQKYYSVMLTGIDLIEDSRDSEEPIVAYSNSYKSSMCTLDKSCTIQPWTPETLPYQLAAAIGHSLGMTSGCEGKQSVRNTNFKPKEAKSYWNECNRNDLRNYLTSDEAMCIQKDHDKMRLSPTRS